MLAEFPLVPLSQLYKDYPFLWPRPRPLGPLAGCFWMAAPWFLHCGRCTLGEFSNGTAGSGEEIGVQPKQLGTHADIGLMLVGVTSNLREANWMVFF